ncbi:TPA: hypothetical protein PF072_002458 [Staphylococcus aureus]|nr:hypothetical protein [Staphylococcus aureus]
MYHETKIINNHIIYYFGNCKIKLDN